MSNSGLQSLSEIFDKRIFLIPDFQRGYSWGKRQLEDFWSDMQNLSDDKIHYIGLLTVKPIKEGKVPEDHSWISEKGMKAYHVIDGQQRLTTMIILLHEILRTLEDGEVINDSPKTAWTERFLYRSSDRCYKSPVFGYEKNDPSEEFFKKNILEVEQGVFGEDKETLYTANLMQAKDYFKEKLEKCNKEEKEKIFEKAANRFKFNYYEIDDSLDVNVTFETMNNRGKELSHLELLKNRLIYLSTLLRVEDETKRRLREDINKAWKIIYEYLGKNKENRLDDDEFLYNHWIMYFTYNRNMADAYAEDLLKERFTYKKVSDGEISFEYIETYIKSLSECVKSWFYMFNIHHSDYSDRIKEHVKKLARLGWGAFRPLTMAVFTKEDKDEKEDLIWKFLSACERFDFLIFSVSDRRSNTKNSDIYKMAREYYKGEEGKYIETITSEIDDLTEEWLDLHRFKNTIEELFRKNDGFYSWRGLKYFLYEYELYLQGRAGDNDEKVGWENFNKREREKTIEHIYPQNPRTRNRYWSDRFGNLKPKEKKHYKHSLGNLLLLSRSKNSNLQNFDFDSKKNLKSKDGKNIGYYNGSYSEIEVAQEKEWTPRKIRERGIKMLKFMEERWKFRFKDQDVMKDLLMLP